MVGAWTRQLWSFGGSDATTTIDLGRRRRFVAYSMLNMLDPLTDFDRDNAIVAEVYRVDGTSNKWSWVYGGDHWGDNCAFSNAHPGSANGHGRRITFRLRNFHTDLTAGAVVTVLALD